MSRVLLIALFATLGLGACSDERAPLAAGAGDAEPAAATPEPAAQPEPIEVTRYRCNGSELEARFFEHAVELHVEGRTVTLSEVVAASGARYASGGDPAEVEFWSKGREAMLTMKDRHFPTCRAVGDAEATTRYRAIGQEPGWSLTWWGDGLALTFAADNERIEGESVVRSEAEGGFMLSALSPRGALRLTVESDALCRDTMSGMPHPDRVRLRVGEDTYQGCGGDPAALLQGAAWRVYELDGVPVLAEPAATLHFLGDGQVAGGATCNRYSAAFSLSGEGLRVGPIMATKMACMGDGIMAQESLFLDILGSATRFDFDDDGRLVIHSGDGRSLIAQRESD